MKGTEKQIKYAMDILARIKEEAETEIMKAEKRIAERAAVGKTSRGTVLKAKAERVLATVSQLPESDIHAGIIINTLNSYYSLLDHLEAHDNDVTRLVRYTL